MRPLSGHRRRVATDLVVPVLGFWFCFAIWLNLSRIAQIAGWAWLALGVAYVAVRTRGFRAPLVPPTLSDS